MSQKLVENKRALAFVNSWFYPTVWGERVFNTMDHQALTILVSCCICLLESVLLTPSSSACFQANRLPQVYCMGTINGY